MIETPTAEYRRVLHLYAAATKKDDAAVLNHFQKNVLIASYGVIKNTPRADTGEIESKFLQNDNGFKLAAVRLKGGKSSGQFRRKKDKATGEWTKGAEIGSKGSWQKRVGELAKTLKGKAKSASGYAVSGWIKCAKLLGIPTKGKAKASHLNADVGDAYAATEARLEVFLENSSKDITKARDARLALMMAERGALRDMETYATNKLEKTARMYSGK